MCNLTVGYAVKRYGQTEAMIMEDENCQQKLEDLAKKSKPDSYVLMSTERVGRTQKITCVFEYSSRANIIRSIYANLALYHKNCDEEYKLISEMNASGG